MAGAKHDILPVIQLSIQQCMPALRGCVLAVIRCPSEDAEGLHLSKFWHERSHNCRRILEDTVSLEATP